MHDVLNARRGITARTALLPGGRLGTSAELWMNLPLAHDGHRPDTPRRLNTSALQGSERLRLANEGAARASIAAFIDALLTTPLTSTSAPAS